MLSLLCVGGAIALVTTKFARSYNAPDDAFGTLHVPDHLGAAWLVGPCFVAAAVFHPNLNKDWLSDVSWTFSMCVRGSLAAGRPLARSRAAAPPRSPPPAARERAAAPARARARPPRYLESLAVVPQLFMFQKQNSSSVESLISHFVSALGLARVVEMAFWMSSFHELADVNGSRFVGVLVLVVQFVHVALMADFFYFYVVSLKTGEPMQLPTAAGMV